MTDAELLEWLRKPYGNAMMERAADRIEALLAEVNGHQDEVDTLNARFFFRDPWKLYERDEE